jgi:hypothetical protein
MGKARVMYKLVVPKDVRELIRTMHPSLKKKVKASLKIILTEPSLGKALMDELSGLRSFRTCCYRPPRTDLRRNFSDYSKRGRKVISVIRKEASRAK